VAFRLKLSSVGITQASYQQSERLVAIDTIQMMIND